MEKRVLIEWPELGLQATATLATDKNPELCADLWDSLPFESFMSNAVVTGSSMYCWTPIVSFAPIHHKELICEAPIGRLRYGQADGNKIIIQYGPCYDNVKGTVLGKVDDVCLDVLAQVGTRAMHSTYLSKEKLMVRFSRLGEEEGAKGPAYATLAGDSQAAQLCREIGEASLEAATKEPQELIDLRNGKVSGSFGQYFSTWEFAYSFLRDLSMYTLFGIAKFSRREEVNVQMAANLYQDITPPYIWYLEEWGFAKLYGFSSRFTKLMQEDALSKEEFLLILENLCRYTNMLSAWSYLMFPWGIGAAFQAEPKGGQDKS